MVHCLYVKKPKITFEIKLSYFFYMSIKASFANSTGIVDFHAVAFTDHQMDS